MITLRSFLKYLEKKKASMPKPPVKSIIDLPLTIVDLYSAVNSEDVCSIFNLFGK